jgi:hypothetical protein
LPVPMAEFANGLRASCSKRQGAQDAPGLLDAATQQPGQSFLVLLCDFDAQGWTTHTPSMRQNISEWNCFLEPFYSVRDLVLLC